MIELGGYLLSDDKALIQLDRVCEMLWTTYWAKDRPKDIIAKSIEHSLCFGVYQNGVQVGFARCITDYATLYYLCDVIIDEVHRGQGLGKALVKYITEYEILTGAMGLLGTRDAHGLYEKYGFICDAGMYRPADKL